MAMILLVEDEILIRNAVFLILRKSGYEVVEAANGQEAIDILSSDQAIDMVFTDIVMPGPASGIMVARKTSELRPGIPVLMTSGYSDEFLRGQGLEVGSVLLAKPYLPAELLRRIGDLLGADAPDKGWMDQSASRCPER